MNGDFQYLSQSKIVNGQVVIYAMVRGYYGWYALNPIELPAEELSQCPECPELGVIDLKKHCCPARN